MEPSPLRSPAAPAAVLVLLLAAILGSMLVLNIGEDVEEGPTIVRAPVPRYLALGDSVAVGVGASDPALSGYVPLVRDALVATTEDVASAVPSVQATNLAVGGETTASLITDGQLDSALQLLERTEDAARHVITLTIGGNDATRLLPICGSNPEAQPTEACEAAADAVLGTWATTWSQSSATCGRPLAPTRSS